MRKIKSRTWFINWIKYCQAYLELARIGVLELNDVNHRPTDAFTEGSIYRDQLLLVPAIWCLKHAIELLFKALDIRITEEYLLAHDNADLHAEIKEAFKVLKIESSPYLAELLELSDKYYKLKFWDSFLASRDVVDDSNDVFRYPENKVSFVLDISELHKVTEENRQEIVKDIERLSRLLLKLHSEITTGKIKKEK
jgi:hypothetical protein